MSHPNLLELSMLTDGALDPTEADAIRAHVETCTVCQAQVTELRTTGEYLNTAMQMDNDADLQIPKFSRPVSLRNFALANVATGLAIWLGQFLWKTIFGEVVVNAASWFTSIYLPDIYAMSSAALLYLLTEGTAMLDTYLGLIVVTVAAIAAVIVWLKRPRTHSSLNMCVGVALIATFALPAPAGALEVRRDDDVVVIAATEVIDDTLVVAAESVVIEGTVTGSLIAVGQSVDINGTVGGNVVTFAEDINVRGDIGGSVLGGSSTFNISGATVNGNAWLAGETLTVGRDANIGNNATLAGESVTVEGTVGKDLSAFCENVELNGAVGADLEAFAGRLRLLGDANVAGDVRFRSRDEDRLYRADSAQVGGKVEFLSRPEEFEPENQYAEPEFYLWQAAQLIGAFLVGWVLLTLLPGMGRLTIGAGIEGLKSAGIGLLALVSVPVAAVITAVTLIGIPIALILVGVWMLGIYLSQIVIGSAIGRMLMPENDSTPQTLIVGLLLVTIAVNLPFIGGVIGFVLIILGLGLLVQYLYRTATSRSAPGISASGSAQ